MPLEVGRSTGSGAAVDRYVHTTLSVPLDFGRSTRRGAAVDRELSREQTGPRDILRSTGSGAAVDRLSGFGFKLVFQTRFLCNLYINPKSVLGFNAREILSCQRGFSRASFVGVYWRDQVILFEGFE